MDDWPMTRFKRYLIFLFPVIFYGCEKVIEVNLNEAAPKIVIEGNISSDNNFAEVKISMTSSYFDTLPGDKVSGAKVVVTDNEGGKFIFRETKEGLYKSPGISLKQGNTYQLSVESGNEIFLATSKLNSPVPIDSVKTFYEPGSSFIDEGYYLNVYFTDPKGVENFYRIKVFRNGKEKKSTDDFIVFNDRYVEGNNVKITLFNDPYEINDTVRVQLISLDKDAFEFHRTFIDLVNTNPGSAAPANPNTNFSNGALGYFSAWSSDNAVFVIKKE